MAEGAIRSLIAAHDAAGGLARVTAAVDPARDMAAIALKLFERGQASLFENAGGMRAASQLLSERAQWARALGHGEDELLAFVQRALRQDGPAAIEADAAPLAPLARGLAALPVPRAAAGDFAAQMAAVAVALDPATGRSCVGLTRHTVLAPGRLSAIDLCPALERLPRGANGLRLALVIGGDPALVLAAAIGTWRASGLGLAGALAGAPVALARAGGIAFPAAAEIVILGRLRAETARVGRLATPFGTYAEPADAPVFEVMSVLARPDAIFHALHIGVPGDMAGARCLAAEALVAEHIRNIEGGIDFMDVRCPAAGGAQVVVIQLKPRQEGQAKTALMGALSGPVNTLKLAIAVDEDVEQGAVRDVFWSVASRTHAETDVGMIDGMRAHRHELGGPLTTRWLIDSTMPPLTQGKRRDDFARAIPKNLAAVDLARFLPKP